MEFDAALIDERVWLGSLEAMKHTAALAGLHITHIVTLLESDLELEANDAFARKHIRVEDNQTTDLLVEFDACYNFIEGALSADPTNNVLIHCQAGSSTGVVLQRLACLLSSLGVSRSATVACMWLMRRYQLSARDALQRLSLARPAVRPNASFSAQLSLFERMNRQCDTNHQLYKELQLERARAIYIDHDTEKNGIDEKNQLREQFCRSFTLPYGHAACTITNTYRCRGCQYTLFSNADIFTHPAGRGLYDWSTKHSNHSLVESSSGTECRQQVFTNYLEWFMKQMNTSANSHEGPIQCPHCLSIVGSYHLNGKRCSCDKWLVPAFYFDSHEIEQRTVTDMASENTIGRFIE